MGKAIWEEDENFSPVETKKHKHCIILPDDTKVYCTVKFYNKFLKGKRLSKYERQ